MWVKFFANIEGKKMNRRQWGHGLEQVAKSILHEKVVYHSHFKTYVSF